MSIILKKKKETVTEFAVLLYKSRRRVISTHARLMATAKIIGKTNHVNSGFQGNMRLQLIKKKKTVFRSKISQNWVWPN